MIQFSIYLCIFALLAHVTKPHAEAIDVLSLLFDEVETRRTMNPTRDQEKSRIINRLSQVPFSSKVKSNAWYKLNKFQSVDMISDNEWKLYEPLIPFMPPEMFQKVNYSDESLLQTFGKFKLSPTQLSMIAEHISEIWGSEALENEDKVILLGNIFCGFPDSKYKHLNSSLLKFLLKKKFFQGLHGCTVSAIQTITRELQRYTIVGPTRAWTPEITASLGVLLAGLNAQQLRSLREDCISEITPDVVHMIPVNVLQNLRQEQLQALRKDSLLAWRRKTKDKRYLYGKVQNSSSSRLNTLFFTLFLAVLVNVSIQKNL